MAVNEAMVRTAVERHLPAINAMSTEELEAELGAFVASQEVLDPDTEVDYNLLVRGGDTFIRTRSKENLQQRVCRHKERIEVVISTGNVSTVVTVLLTILRITAVVPTIIITLAVLLLRIGLDEYCRD